MKSCLAEEAPGTGDRLATGYRGASKGQHKNKPKPNQWTYVLYSAWNWLRRACDVVIFLIAFLSYRETPENAIKKSVRGESLDARPRKTFFVAFLSFPYREALNQRNKKVERKKSRNIHPKKKSLPEKIFPC
jgi:hypothetical protein